MKIVWFAAFSFVSLKGVADTPATLSMGQMYNYEQLSQVADYLGARVEDPKVKMLSCDFSSDKSTLLLSGPLRELIDSKRPDEISAFKQDSKKYISKVKGCALRCSCNGYSLMLSDMSGETKSDEYKDFEALLNSETKKLTKVQSVSCAKKLKWFCKSSLQKFLQQQ